MATRGRKPKPPELRVVDGTHNVTRHGEKPELDDQSFEPADLDKPQYLKAGSRASAIWDEVVAQCWWLGEADVYAIGMFCQLQAEYERSPSKMIAARIAQLRAVRSELGLDPSSRSRLGSMRGARKRKADEEAEPKSKAASYFDT